MDYRSRNMKHQSSVKSFSKIPKAGLKRIYFYWGMASCLQVNGFGVSTGHHNEEVFRK
jgi:hypothetical protein